MLQGKKILLGVCGSIAAYKSAVLVRLLIKNGAEVKVIMTPDATKFITAETLSVLSKNKTELTFFQENHSWTNHVELGLWADAFLIAPATANTLAKMAQGICDNLLLATYLSARCPVFFAPAMDLDMYRHPATIKNIQTLISFQHQLIPAENGELASGLVGEGRMAEPEHIVSYLAKNLNNLVFKGKKVLITAGPTYEAIDPVRFIGNRSSGKMGVAIAAAFAAAGAEVKLIHGPISSISPSTNITTIAVESAKQMHEACLRFYADCDIVIMSAAVADYRPAEIAAEKIKKGTAGMSLNLIKNEDILFDLGRRKQQQCLVGFALETQQLLEYAREKLQKKNLDFIIANSASEPGSGFAGDTNKITIIDKNNKVQHFELKNKTEVAADIVRFTQNYLGL